MEAPTAVAVRDPAELIMSDDEIRRMFRIAEAFALGGAWKDIRKAEAAFSKMVIGRDLGMTAAQSMQGIHLVDGNIQMHYATLGQWVRERPGYEYRAAWIKVERWTTVEEGRVRVLDRQEGSVTVRMPDGEVIAVLEHGPIWDEQVLVWHDEEDPLDLRPVFGAAIRFTVGDEQRGVSIFTLDDARQARLIKEDPRAAWNTSPRNMLLARAMSNGIKWFVPEVMNGMPVYTLGETPERKSLTAPTGDGDDEGTGIDLGPKVEKIIERATALGHRGLSNKANVEMSVGQRAPSVVNQWVKDATAELNRFEEAKKAEKGAVEPTEEPVAEEATGVVVEPDAEDGNPHEPGQPGAPDNPHDRLTDVVEPEDQPEEQ